MKLAQKHVGECLWLATKTRPDIMFVTTHAASMVSKRPSYVIRLSKRVLAYLAGTVDLRMTMGPRNEEDALELVAFTDASYAPYGRRSFGAAVITLAGAPVAWKSGRQSFITLSVMEAELYAATQGCTLLKSVQALVTELFPTALTCVLAVDNTSAVAMLAGGPGSQRTRHLKIRANYVREEVEQGRLIVRHTPGSMQLADLSTKMQSKLRLHQLLQLWGFVGFATNVLQEMKLKILAALMVLAQCICPARAQANELKEPLPTTTWDEAVVTMIVVAIVAVLVWEALRFVYRRILRCRRRWLKAKRLEQVSQFASTAARREIATTTKDREATSSVRRRTTTQTRSRSSTPLAPMTPPTTRAFTPPRTTSTTRTPSIHRSQDLQRSPQEQSASSSAALVRPTTPPPLPRSTRLEESEARSRVCKDTLQLMTCEDLRSALRLEGMPVSGVKGDLTEGLVHRLVASDVTSKQLRYVLYLWRLKSLNFKCKLRWEDINSKCRISTWISVWKDA